MNLLKRSPSVQNAENHDFNIKPQLSSLKMRNTFPVFEKQFWINAWQQLLISNDN